MGDVNVAGEVVLVGGRRPLLPFYTAGQAAMVAAGGGYRDVDDWRCAVGYHRCGGCGGYAAELSTVSIDGLSFCAGCLYDEYLRSEGRL